MQKNCLAILLLCAMHTAVHALDFLTIGLVVAPPILNACMTVIAQRLFAKDHKTERDRINESLAVQLALLNSSEITPELKKSILHAIMREEEKARCLDIKDYLESADVQKEDQELVIWAQKEIQESGKRVLQLAQNTV